MLQGPAPAWRAPRRASHRYSDQPTIEVTQRVRCDVPTAWNLVTDIGLPARCSSELQAVEWIDDADAVAVGARSAVATSTRPSGIGQRCARSSRSRTSAAGCTTSSGPGDQRDLGVRGRAGQRRRADPPMGSDRPGTVGADPGDRRATGEGGQDRRPATGRMAAEHAVQPGPGPLARRSLRRRGSALAQRGQQPPGSGNATGGRPGQRVQRAFGIGRSTQVPAAARAVFDCVGQIEEGHHHVVGLDVGHSDSESPGCRSPSRCHQTAAPPMREVCRPLPISVTSPTARCASGTRRFTNVDLPTPE